MKLIYMQVTVNHMFKVDPVGSQLLFDSRGSEFETKEITDIRTGEPIVYYVYDLKD